MTITPKVCGITPILSVKSLPASLAYYVAVLGFSVDWQGPGGVASVSRDGSAIMLCQGDQGTAGTWLWIGVSDITPLLGDFLTNGALIRHGPTNYPWAFEVQVEDPDGHVLRFGSDVRAGQPYGDWLDMHGGRWTPGPDGEWTRAEKPPTTPRPPTPSVGPA